MSKARSIEEKVGKFYFIKIKNIHSMKDHRKKMKNKGTAWEKMCANHN